MFFSFLGLSVLVVKVVNILCLSQSLTFGTGVRSLYFQPMWSVGASASLQAPLLSAGLLPLYVGFSEVSSHLKFN